MKKTFIYCACMFLFTTYAIAQEKVVPATDIKSTEKKVSSTKTTSAKKIDKTKKVTITTKAQTADEIAKQKQLLKEKNKNNKQEPFVMDPAHPLTSEQLRQRQLQELQMQQEDPAHPLTAEQLKQRQLQKGGTTVKNAPLQPPTPQQLKESQIQKQKVNNKNMDPAHPLTAEEMQKQQIGNQQIVMDPAHPLTVEEIRKLQLKNGPVPPNPNAVGQPPLPPGQNQASNEEPAIKDPKAPKFKFTDGDTFDYGEILESNEPAEHIFEFENVGKKPLTITEAHGSCGCTVPSWPKEAIAPGKKGQISVKYSSKGRVGAISKEVTITSNADPSQVMLHIRGTVKSNPDLSTTPAAH